MEDRLYETRDFSNKYKKVSEGLEKDRSLSKQKIKSLLEHVSRLGKERDSLKTKESELEDKVQDLNSSLNKL
jgi:hypothetical protein